MKIIAVCSCSGMKEKAIMAYKIAFPKTDVPEVVRGEDAIRALANRLQSTNVSKYLNAIAKKNGQYAYYIKYDENGDVAYNYDLLLGRRIA